MNQRINNQKINHFVLSKRRSKITSTVRTLREDDDIVRSAPRQTTKSSEGFECREHDVSILLVMI
jgi:hypothetical protein